MTFLEMTPVTEFNRSGNAHQQRQHLSCVTWHQCVFKRHRW